MATISSIGTSSRNYSTIAAWLAAFTTGGWEGECYNDTEFVITAQILFNQATSAPNYIILRCASGQSFNGNSANALYYNQANGVGIRSVTDYIGPLLKATAQFVTFDGLQVYYNAKAGACVQGTVTNFTVQNCILTGTGRSNATDLIADITGAASVIRNCVLVSNGTSFMSGLRLQSSAVGVNNTIVQPNTNAGGKGVTGLYGTNIARNNAIFGFPTAPSGPFSADGHNATDITTAPGSTSNLISQAFTTATFASITVDFKAVSGSCLLDAGVTDSTNVPSAADIFGTSRPQGSAWDIGAFELTSGAGVTGSTAWTEVTDTIAATGSLGVFAAGAWIEVTDSIAATGTLGVFGTGAWTEVTDGLAATGTLTLPGITGDVAWTEAQDTLAAEGGNASQDTHDPGLRKRLKKAEELRRKRFEDEARERARRKAQVVTAFERAVEGIEPPAEFVEQMVAMAKPPAAQGEAPPRFDFAALGADAGQAAGALG
jgi:hypothetical protein